MKLASKGTQLTFGGTRVKLRAKTDKPVKIPAKGTGTKPYPLGLSWGSLAKQV